MSQSNSSSGRGYLTGLLPMCMVFLWAITFGMIPTDPSAIDAPGWMLAIFGGVFVVAGLWSILQGMLSRRAAGVNWINLIFALLVLMAISVICLWIGFGPGPRLFVNTDSITGMRTSLSTDPTLGRIFFGFFGILLSGVTIAIAVIEGRKLTR
jgi:heme/copper-type cytochrome/quinol oxidase subunit 4